jgi:hypothetical protein
MIELSSLVAANGAEICEVLKISERSEEKFSEFCKSLVVRSAEASAKAQVRQEM